MFFNAPTPGAAGTTGGAHPAVSASRPSVKRSRYAAVAPQEVCAKHAAVVAAYKETHREVPQVKSLLSIFSFKKVQSAEQVALQAVKEGWRPPTVALDAALGPPSIPSTPSVMMLPTAATAAIMAPLPASRAPTTAAPGTAVFDFPQAEGSPNYTAALSLSEEQYALLTTDEQNEYALWWARSNGLA